MDSTSTNVNRFAVTANTLSLCNGGSWDVATTGVRLNRSGSIEVQQSDTVQSITPTKISNWDAHITNNSSVTAQTTQAVYPIKIDSKGHISGYGSAVTNIVTTGATQTLSAKTLSAPVVSGNLRFDAAMNGDTEITSETYFRVVHKELASGATWSYTRTSGSTYLIMICAATASNSGLYLVHGSNVKAISASGNTSTSVAGGSATALTIKVGMAAQVYLMRFRYP